MIEIRADTELEIASVQGESDEEIDFVERIGNPVEVIDADRVLVRLQDVGGIVADAKVAGLEVELEKVERLR